ARSASLNRLRSGSSAIGGACGGGRGGENPGPFSGRGRGGVSPGRRGFPGFGGVKNARPFVPFPDWVVWGIVISTPTQAVWDAIADGRYKAVNTAGAAVLAGITNALPDIHFPFVFNGDGASFALPGRHLEVARDVLARTAAWVHDTLGLNLRTAAIPVSEIRT